MRTQQLLTTTLVAALLIGCGKKEEAPVNAEAPAESEARASGALAEEVSASQQNGLPDNIQRLLDTIEEKPTARRLLEIIEKEAIAFPSRSDELQTLKRWLADGDYSLARSKAAGIIKQQRNLRLTKQNGLPDDIQQLLGTIEKESQVYPSRSDELQTLKRWLADGDYSLARSKAAGIIKQQRNLRQAQEKGVPDDIQRLLDTIDKEATAYPSRSDELQTLKRWIADGDFSLARSKASGIIKQQRNLRQAQAKGVPDDIQRLLDIIEKETITFPSRSDELQTLKRWLADGDFSLARSKAAGIIKQQRNLRRTKQDGLPDDIQQLLLTIEKEAIAYPSRSDELQTLKRWLADGEYSLSRSKAAGIIKQQRNLK